LRPARQFNENIVTHKSTRIEVRHSADQMFALVADIERYPEFLPWCVALRIVGAEERPPKRLLTADMVVAYKVFREKFRSKVALESSASRISARYIDGPFRSLETEWRFEPLKSGCVINFEIDFEFRSLLLQATARSVFDRAFSKMAEAFAERAEFVYGPKIKAPPV
jgi:coenzyme Q-binding protein COQ10